MPQLSWRPVAADEFDANSVTPLELVYENLTHDLDRAVREVAGFLVVTLPPYLARCRPRLRRQADHHTERLARLYLRNDRRVIAS